MKAAHGAKRGQYAPLRLAKAAEDLAEEYKGFAPLREGANLASDVVDLPILESTLPARQAYMEATRSTGGTFANLIGGAMGFVPFLGKTLGSKRFQNFLMGNMGWQRRLQAAVRAKDARKVALVVEAVRNASSAQPVIRDEANDFAGEF
jgi:hypothetical protein